MHTRTHTHTCARTHTYTHTCARPVECGFQYRGSLPIYGKSLHMWELSPHVLDMSVLFFVGGIIFDAEFLHIGVSQYLGNYCLTGAHTHTHIHTHTFKHTHTNTHTHTHTHSHTHMCTHTYTHMHAHTHTHRHTHTQAFTHTHTHAHTFTHTYTHTCAHTQTCACTHAHTHAHTHTRSCHSPWYSLVGQLECDAFGRMCVPSVPKGISSGFDRAECSEASTCVEWGHRCENITSC
jgi:hypothetical protein